MAETARETKMQNQNQNPEMGGGLGEGRDRSEFEKTVVFHSYFFLI